jgi:hypothetical protein
MHYAIVQQIENVGQKCNTRWYIVTERENVGQKCNTRWYIVTERENVGRKCNTRWYIVTERENVQLYIYRKNIRLHYLQKECSSRCHTWLGDIQGKCSA